MQMMSSDLPLSWENFSVTGAGASTFYWLELAAFMDFELVLVLTSTSSSP